MTENDVAQSIEEEQVAEPSGKAKLTAWGGVVVIVFAMLLVAWGALKWGDVIPIPFLGYLPAKIIGTALAVVGGMMMARTGTHSVTSGATSPPAPDVGSGAGGA